MQLSLSLYLVVRTVRHCQRVLAAQTLQAITMSVLSICPSSLLTPVPEIYSHFLALTSCQ